MSQVLASVVYAIFDVVCFYSTIRIHGSFQTLKLGIRKISFDFKELKLTLQTNRETLIQLQNIAKKNAEMNSVSLKILV